MPNAARYAPFRPPRGGCHPRDLMTPEREAACHAALQAKRSWQQTGERSTRSPPRSAHARTSRASRPAVAASSAATGDTRWTIRSWTDGQARGRRGRHLRLEEPVLLARCVMERTPHVLTIGGGALALGREAGLPSRVRASSSRRSGGTGCRTRSAWRPRGTSTPTPRAATAPSAPSPATATATLPRPPRPAA